MTSLLISHSRTFRYSSLPGLKTTELVIDVVSSINPYLSVVIDQISGFSKATALAYWQLHVSNTEPFPGQLPLITLPVPADMPFSWQMPEGGYIATVGYASIWWSLSSDPVSYQLPGGGGWGPGFVVNIQGRASLGDSE
jgi:hypothetical protein